MKNLTCKDDGNGKWTNNAEQFPKCTQGDDRAVCNPSFIQSMCTNKDLSDKLFATTGTYNGEDERYANTMSMYNTEVLNAFNLGIGVMLGALFLYQV